jgi:hypothetical protein
MLRYREILLALFLATVVAVGIAALWGIGVLMAEDSMHVRRVEMLAYETPVRTARGILIRYPAQIWLRSDGTAFVSNAGYRPDGGQQYYSLDLQPINLTGKERWLIGAELRTPLRPSDGFTRLSWRERLIPAGGTASPPQHWYFLHDGQLEGRGYFIGYDATTKLPVGYLGKLGFSVELPPRTEWFEMDGRRVTRRLPSVIRQREESARHYPGGVYLPLPAALLPKSAKFFVSGGRLWSTDLHTRVVQSLTDDEGIIGFDVSRAPGNENNLPLEELTSKDARFVVRTPDKVMLIDLTGKEEAAWVMPDELRDKALSWYVLDGGKAAVIWTDRKGDDLWWLQTELAWVDRDGRIDRRQSFVLRETPRPKTAWVEAVATLSLPFFALNRGPYYWHAISLPETFSQMIADNWPALAVISAISALLAVLAYRRQMRFALSGAGVWAAFVLLLGVPGFVAYRWHRHWPVLEPCGECHKLVPRDRDACASCGRLFPPPALIGTEIFA